MTRSELASTILSLERRLASLNRVWAELTGKGGHWERQPRAPKGEPNGGEWIKDEARLQLVNDRGGRGSRPLLINGRPVAITPGQQLRYDAASRRAQDAIYRVQQIDPRWRPRDHLYETVEGAISARDAVAREAQARLSAIARLRPEEQIQLYRAGHNMPNLFGRPTWSLDKGTVLVGPVNGRPLFGVNSGAPGYSGLDRADAQTRRDDLIRTFPHVMDRQNIGRMPNDALYHAEATFLLRAARENGGSLAGRELTVVSDRPMCSSCQTVLPYLGLRLGNPSVTFVTPTGHRSLINGSWQRR